MLCWQWHTCNKCLVLTVSAFKMRGVVMKYYLCPLACKFRWEHCWLHKPEACTTLDLWWVKYLERIFLKYLDPLWKICFYCRPATWRQIWHVNDHEVTTKDISDVHSRISRKLNDWFLSVCLSWPYAGLQKLHNVRGNECCVWFRWEWGYSTLCATELVHLSSCQKPQ